jgi:methylated-DNA-[protein]-cysteine S-methyltransferase
MTDTTSFSGTSASLPSAFATIDSPIGRIELESNGRAVTWLSIEGDEHSEHGDLRHGGVAGVPDPVLAQAIIELTEYFSGARHDFTVPVELHGTAFQESVWAELAHIRWGTHRSYADIAEAIGKTGASRAVGGAVGANPVPLLVGCHRVLARDGRITGYSAGSGIATKQWLLTLEGIDSK